MQWFVGTITNKLDAKGRVSVPAPFRQVLAGQGNEGLYCVPSIGGDKSLTGFGNALFTRQMELLKPLNPMFDRSFAPRAHAIFGSARHLSFDDDGRVRLPDDLISHAGISEKISFVGLGEIFEIWNPDLMAEVEKKRAAENEKTFKASQP